MTSNMNGFTNITIASFTIEEISERFYANGRHQCQIRISVLKQGNGSGGRMVKLPLSNREISSLRAVSFSSSLNNNQLMLPSGWSITNSRNIYDLGLINAVRSKPSPRWLPDNLTSEELDLRRNRVFRESHIQEDQDICTECQISEENFFETQNADKSENLDVNVVPDTFDFYISSSATGTQQLMATMQLDVMNNVGVVTNTTTLTTNMSDNNNHIFHSTIRLTAIPPVIINNISPVLQTKHDRRENVTKRDVHHQVITLYTWQLPYNLRAMSRSAGNTTSGFYILGNTHQSNRFLTRGRFFALGTSRVNARDNVRGGCVWDYGYSVTVQPNQICAETLIVSGCSWTSPMHSGTHSITIIDNFGTEHSFRISPADTGKTLTLSRIGN